MADHWTAVNRIGPVSNIEHFWSVLPKNPYIFGLCSKNVKLLLLVASILFIVEVVTNHKPADSQNTAWHDAFSKIAAGGKGTSETGG